MVTRGQDGENETVGWKKEEKQRQRLPFEDLRSPYQKRVKHHSCPDTWTETGSAFDPTARSASESVESTIADSDYRVKNP
jgi:hypothetical protein